MLSIHVIPMAGERVGPRKNPKIRWKIILRMVVYRDDSTYFK